MAKNAIEKTGESTEYLLANARASVQRARRRATRPPVSAMFERAAAGEDFTVLKQFKGDGRIYERGETVRPNATEDSWMLEHRFVLPATVAKDAELAAGLTKFYRDEVVPNETRYREAETNERNALETLETLRLQLARATDALRQAERRKTQTEGDLRASLERMQQQAI